MRSRTGAPARQLAYPRGYRLTAGQDRHIARPAGRAFAGYWTNRVLPSAMASRRLPRRRRVGAAAPTPGGRPGARRVDDGGYSSFYDCPWRLTDFGPATFAELVDNPNIVFPIGIVKNTTKNKTQGGFRRAARGVPRGLQHSVPLQVTLRVPSCERVAAAAGRPGLGARSVGGVPCGREGWRTATAAQPWEGDGGGWHRV